MSDVKDTRELLAETALVFFGNLPQENKVSCDDCKSMIDDLLEDKRALEGLLHINENGGLRTIGFLKLYQGVRAMSMSDASANVLSKLTGIDGFSYDTAPEFSLVGKGSRGITASRCVAAACLTEEVFRRKHRNTLGTWILGRTIRCLNTPGIYGRH